MWPSKWRIEINFQSTRLSCPARSDSLSLPSFVDFHHRKIFMFLFIFNDRMMRFNKSVGLFMRQSSSKSTTTSNGLQLGNYVRIEVNKTSNEKKNVVHIPEDVRNDVTKSTLSASLSSVHDFCKIYFSSFWVAGASCLSSFPPRSCFNFHACSPPFIRAKFEFHHPQWRALDQMEWITWRIKADLHYKRVRREEEKGKSCQKSHCKHQKLTVKSSHKSSERWESM